MFFFFFSLFSLDCLSLSPKSSHVLLLFFFFLLHFWGFAFELLHFCSSNAYQMLFLAFLHVSGILCFTDGQFPLCLELSLVSRTVLRCQEAGICDIALIKVASFCFK